MELSKLGYVGSFSKIPSGAFCLFRVDDVMYLGLKATAQRRGMLLSWVIVLSPGHPEFDGEPGLYSGEIPAMYPVLHLPKAILIPGVDRSSICLGPINQPRSGMLMMHGDDLLMIVRWDRRKLAYIDLSTGISHEDYPEDNVAWSSTWKIVHPGPDEHEVLTTFSATS